MHLKDHLSEGQKDSTIWLKNTVSLFLAFFHYDSLLRKETIEAGEAERHDAFVLSKAQDKELLNLRTQGFSQLPVMADLKQASITRMF